MDPDRTLIVHVEGDEDSDAEHVVSMASDLRRELLMLDVDDVSHPAADAPAGAKGAALEWTQLIVTLAGSAPPLLAALQGWRSRNRGARVAVEVAGERIDLERLEPEQREVIAMWIARHASE